MVDDLRIMVCDGETRHALAAVRSLGAKGHAVHVGCKGKRGQAMLSRFCHGRIGTPDPSDPSYSSIIAGAVEDREIELLLTFTDASTWSISTGRDSLPGSCRLLMPSHDILRRAADKGETLELAEQLGIPVPATPSPAYSGIRVVKPRMGGKVSYVMDGHGLRNGNEGAIVQEFIPGSVNCAFCALMDHGRAIASFTHRELREIPPTGGSATLAESVRNREVAEMGLRLLEALRWHGIAMVEFKEDQRTGSYRLMEINPRFWASLELAIAAGVDFPDLGARMASGEKLDPVTDYREGIRFRWLAQDILRLPEEPSSLPSFLRDFLDPGIRYDLRPGDIRPNLYELSVTLLWTVSIFLGREPRNRIA